MSLHRMLMINAGPNIPNTGKLFRRHGQIQMTLDSRLHYEWTMMSVVAGGMADMWIVDIVLCCDF